MLISVHAKSSASLLSKTSLSIYSQRREFTRACIHPRIGNKFSWLSWEGPSSHVVQLTWILWSGALSTRHWLTAEAVTHLYYSRRREAFPTDDQLSGVNGPSPSQKYYSFVYSVADFLFTHPKCNRWCLSAMRCVNRAVLLFCDLWINERWNQRWRILKQYWLIVHHHPSTAVAWGQEREYLHSRYLQNQQFRGIFFKICMKF